MEIKEFELGRHYYLKDGMVVFTELYHKQRGYCCGNKCRHCVFEPKHQKDNTKLSK